MQLQALNRIMKKQLASFPVCSAMILGVAGGNGLEHVNTEKYTSVYGVDVNSEYLREVKKRYSYLGGTLKCLCLDLTGEISELPSADLVIANLLIEYIGYECFKRVIEQVRPWYVSCAIQVDTSTEFVSDSPYIHCFDELNSVHFQAEADGLNNSMLEIGYKRVFSEETPLPNGKKLVQIDFEGV